jgi:hypothetical protein
MPMRRLAQFAAVALVLLGLLPATVLADGPDVSGTVTATDGSPVAGSTIRVWATSGDMVWLATADETGAWSVTAGIQVGEQLQISAVGPEARTSPDPSGCITTTSMTGAVDVTVDAVPLAPLAVVLDSPVTGTVCDARTVNPDPLRTPPATDAVAPTPSGGGDALPLLIALGMVSAAAVAVAPRRARPR